MNYAKSIAFPFYDALNQNELLKTFYLNTDGQDMSVMMNEKKFTVKEIGFTYRQVSTWDASGLLDVDRQGTDWRLFSIMDKIWLHVIRELRKYGISLKQIAKIKKFLNLNNAVSIADLPMLEIYSCLAPRKIPTSIVVFEDASALICPYADWLSILLGQMVPNHLVIHMGPIFANVFDKQSLIPYPSRLTDLSDEELNILQHIRENNYEEVNIKYKGKKAEILEGLKRFDVHTKVTDVLKAKDYQRIELVKHNGELRQITAWEKNKL